MHIDYIPDEHHRAVMRGRARITPKYAIEIMVCDCDGHHTVVCRWYPMLPPWSEIEELSHKIAEAKAPYLREAAQLGCLRVVGVT